MSNKDSPQLLHNGSKTLHVKTHSGTLETQGDVHALLGDVQETPPNADTHVCDDDPVNLKRDANDNELPSKLAHRPGEVVGITTSAVSSRSPAASHESNFISSRRLTSQDTIPQSPSALPLAEGELKQSHVSCKNHVASIKDGQNEQIREAQCQMPQVPDPPAVMRGRVHTLLGQTYELHELPVPREHTKEVKEHRSDNVSIPNHVHIVPHKGYDLQKPNEFFQLYGRYILTLLEMIKYGVTISGFVVPALSTVNASGPSYIFKDSLSTISESDVDHSIEYLQQFADRTSVGQGREQTDGIESYERSNASEGGADLRHLKDFIKDADEHWLPGNLYRVITQQGHVAWVCDDHYRLTYGKIEDQALAAAVEMNGGSYQPQLGKISITLGSNCRAAGFFDALVVARPVVDLDVLFDWDCSRSELEAFEGALKKLTLRKLRIELRHLQTSLVSKLFPMATRHEILFRILGHPSLRIIHIVIPKDIATSSSPPPITARYLSKLYFELTARSIGGNGALELCKSLKTNLTLTALRLVGNSIGDNEARALSKALESNSILTILDLAGNSIRDEGASALSKALRINTTLDKLGLVDNSIGDNGARAISDALKTNSTLTILDLRNNLVWYPGFLALSEIIRTNSTMTTLDLRGNLIGDKSVLEFTDALRTKSIIVTLDLYHSSIEDEGVKALSDAVKSNSTLIALDLGSNSIGDNGAVALSGALKANCTLAALDLRVNSIGDNGVLALLQALKRNSTLTTLNLAWNLIKGNGAQALSGALRINSTLTVLYLSFNSIGDKGARAISKGLEANTALTALYLSSNGIGDKGARALARALKINSALTSLDLYHNVIGNNGARALSKPLKTSSRLTALYLGQNAIEDSGIVALTEALKTNVTLAKLYVLGNPFGDNGHRALYQMSMARRCDITHGIEIDLKLR
ncbi:hypothetical protein BGZ70_000632 [Mortierella alpina]|uniref:RNI-like protein n=1 Tax=Mortierella alpina TaxID=64518 RepID=A0A9P6J0P5_MORAP|nr:hypothetical protein BGZ70_000632 [Mortierella alpina]